MNISRHARKRWPERVNKDAADEDIDREITSEFEQATIVYEEEEPDEGLVQYRVKDNILFIYGVAKDKLITLVDIDYGFSAEVNLELCRLQVARVLKLKDKIESEAKAVEQLNADIDNKLLAVAAEITEFEAKLEAAKATERRLNQQKVENSKGLEALKAEFANEFLRLKYSIRYRVDASKIRNIV